MSRISYFFALAWMTTSLAARGDENAEVLARRSELQRQKEEIQRVDIQVTRIAAAWQKISSNFESQANSLQSTLASLISLANAQSAEMERLSQWMTEKYRFLNTSADPAAFRSVMEEYRTLRSGTSCGKNKTEEPFRLAVGSIDTMGSLRNEAAELDRTWPLPPQFDEMRTSIRSGSESLADNYESAKKSVFSVLPLTIPSSICDSFLQFDTVISLSQTVAEVNKASAAIDAIDLNSFLKKVDDVTAERNQIKQVRRLLTSMAARNITDIRAGKMNETLHFAATYQKQIDGMMVPMGSLKYVAEAEKGEATAKLNSSITDIAKELENSKVFTSDGKRAFHLTRSRNVQTRLFKLSSATLDPSKADLYQKVKDFCLSQLGMSPTGRYSLPATLDFDQSVKLDANLAKAQDMLKKIDGVEI